MTEERLADLDELILRCRNGQARKYISEAVACYRAAVFRSSIVATWIAVVFDFINKLHELEVSGDANARRKLVELDQIVRDRNIKKSLDFERGVLDEAKDTFELLSPSEYDDLNRLLADRNRCAHPSMNSFDEIYQPTAELARFHLRNAVTHLLQHPPVQGKSALNRLQNEVLSPYFPRSVVEAVKAFKTGPLVRPREALVRNFAISLVKKFLIDTATTLDEELRLASALGAVRQMHPEVSERALAEKINEVMRGISDERFGCAVRFLHSVPDTWQFLEDDICSKISNYAAAMPTTDLQTTFAALFEIPALCAAGRMRLQSVTINDLASIIDAKPIVLRDEFIEYGVDLYIRAASWYEANTLASHVILPIASLLDTQHIERIFEAATRNSQIMGSRNYGQVLHGLRDVWKGTREDFNGLCTRLGLDQSQPGLLFSTAQLNAAES